MKTKKSLLIAPALGVLLLAAAGSVSGTVAWFSASRVFKTEVGNFSVVEIDGNLNVTMAAGQGTVKVGDDIKVRDTDDINYIGQCVTGLAAAKPEDAAGHNNDRYYATDTKKMYLHNGSAWSEEPLVEGKYYYNKTAGGYYVVTNSSDLEPTSATIRKAVLTHGSVAHTGTKESHAFVIDGDSTSDFVDKGADVSPNWRHIENVTIKDNHENDQIVDVYNAVSWTMTFTYTFASDSSPVAVYLDMNASNFVDPTIDPNFMKNGSDPRKTSKGFRISFSGGSGAHDVVWGNETAPITSSIPEEYNRASSYTNGSSKAVHDGKIYVCNTDITADTEDWTPAHWTLTQDISLHNEFVATTSYVVDDIVIYEGKAYKCNTPGANAWDADNWDEVDTGDLRYVSNGKVAGEGTSATSLYSTSDYVWHKSESRLENLDANEFETFKPGVSRSSRICVLTPGSNTVTINCAAWFEGTDPNVVSGAAMECLKANMTFYSRTVNADA